MTEADGVPPGGDDPVKEPATGATDASMNGDRGPGLRVDKWLWFARFFKSRLLAARQCAEGRVRVNGARVAKAHAVVRPGDVLTFPAGARIRVVRVAALGARRGPAPEARLLYDDLEPPLEKRARADPAAPAPVAARPPGAGRPTKAQRRAIDRLKLKES